MSADRERQSWEPKEEGEGERLPPGQAWTKRFPVLHYGSVPHTPLESWDLRVFGAVERQERWTWDEFCELPRAKVKIDVHCVTRWSKADTEWEGVHLRTLIEGKYILPKPSAQYLLQHCENGFTVNVPLELAMSPNFLLATHYNGLPLEPEHGHPLRCVVGATPERCGQQDVYFWKGGKWLRGLEFLEQDKLGFWEQSGYHNRANIWQEQRFV